MTLPTPPTETNIEVIQGGTYAMRVTWNDNQATPQPIDLTDYFSIMQIRNKRAKTGVLLGTLTDSFGTGTGITYPGPESNGQIDVRIGADITALMTKTTYYYDLFVVSKTDLTNATRLVFGSITVSPSVTVVPSS